MRKCEICNKEFERLPNGPRRKYCFECSPSRTNGQDGKHKVVIRQAYKRELVNLLGGECLHCGIKGNQVIFDLHHINEDEKEFGISSGGKTRKWKNILLEAKKCALLCKNCHALHHIGEIQIDFSKANYDLINKRLEIINQPKVKELRLRKYSYAKITSAKIKKNKSSRTINPCKRYS